MAYKTQSLDVFNRQLKRLAKKYPSLKKEILNLVSEIESNPFTGTPLGKNCFKIRLAIQSKGKGKSGGARVITCVKIVKETIYFLSIYDKSEQPDIDDDDLNYLVKLIP